jgi:hypothetical protein
VGHTEGRPLFSNSTEKKMSTKTTEEDYEMIGVEDIHLHDAENDKVTHPIILHD